MKFNEIFFTIFFTVDRSWLKINWLKKTRNCVWIIKQKHGDAQRLEIRCKICNVFVRKLISTFHLILRISLYYSQHASICLVAVLVTLASATFSLSSTHPPFLQPVKSSRNNLQYRYIASKYGTELGTSLGFATPRYLLSPKLHWYLRWLSLAN